MLSREDSLRLAEMERQLWQDDPDFCSRMTGGGSRLPQQHTHRRNSLSLSLLFTATVIWIAAVTLGVLGWWLAAAAAAFCGSTVFMTFLYRRSRRRFRRL
ncbi:MAG: DUF3040 domain-containing protein [Actinoplanes sp.]